MNVLITCECSQTVCAAFRSFGHNAFSCDIEPEQWAVSTLKNFSWHRKSNGTAMGRFSMRWHKYSDEKPKPSEICLVKYFYDKQKFGYTKPKYMLCEYSFRGEESSEPFTELNGEAETYGSNYAEYFISISEIEEALHASL